MISSNAVHLLQNVISRFRPLSQSEKTLCQNFTQPTVHSSASSEQKIAYLHTKQWDLAKIRRGSMVLVRVEDTEEKSYFHDAVAIVLLMKKSSTIQEGWEGYMMGAECEYAGEWDLVLEGEVIFWAETIQVWNTVTLKESQMIREVGRLKAVEVRLIENWTEQLKKQKTGPTKTKKLQRRRIGDFILSRGTKVRHPSDPRCLYQFFYHEISMAISMMAKK